MVKGDLFLPREHETSDHSSAPVLNLIAPFRDVTDLFIACEHKSCTFHISVCACKCLQVCLTLCATRWKQTPWLCLS